MRHYWCRVHFLTRGSGDSVPLFPSGTEVSAISQIFRGDPTPHIPSLLPLRLRLAFGFGLTSPVSFFFSLSANPRSASCQKENIACVCCVVCVYFFPCWACSPLGSVPVGLYLFPYALLGVLPFWVLSFSYGALLGVSPSGSHGCLVVTRHPREIQKAYMCGP